MKNKRGFTLIELITTVSLLAALAVIIILNLNSNLNKQKKREYVEFVEKVKAATNVYWSTGNFGDALYENEKCYIVNVESLANTGLLSLDTLIDPESNLPLSEVIEEDGDSPKRFVKIYKDESSADFIEYPINNIDDISWIVTYVLNGGTGGADCENKRVLFNDSIKLCNPNKTQSIFKGWYLDEGLTNKVESPYIPTTNVTLYAKWEDYYIVTYKEGPKCNYKTVNAGKPLGTLCEPKKTGYTFVKWINESDNLDVSSSTIPTSNMTLIAQWRQNYPNTPTLTLSPSSNIVNGTSVTATLKWSTSDGVTEYCITSSSSSSSCSWTSAPSSGTVSKSITVSGAAGSTVYYYGYVKNTRGESSAGSNYVTIKQTTAPTTPAPCSSITTQKERTFSSCEYVSILGGSYQYPKICTYYFSTITGEYCREECTDYYGQLSYAQPCSGGTSTGGPNCSNGDDHVINQGNFTCGYYVCVHYYNHIKYGPMSDGTYDWACRPGDNDLGYICQNYYCPN